MQFMLLISGDEVLHPDTATATGPINPEFKAYTEAMKKADVWRGGDRLKTTHHAARVRVRDGKSVVLDGPYVDAQGAGRRLLPHRGAHRSTRPSSGRCAARRPRYATVDVRPLAEIPR